MMEYLKVNKNWQTSDVSDAVVDYCWVLVGVESGEYTGISIPVRGLCISKKLKEQPPAVICVK